MMSRLVAYGAEDGEGRALMLISALHHAAEALAGTEIRFVDVRNATVTAALAALRWDTGLDVRIIPEGEEGIAFSDANFFVAVLFRGNMDALPASLRPGIPSMVAVQFPDPWRHGSAVFTLERAAHDPASLARHLLIRLNLS